MRWPVRPAIAFSLEAADAFVSGQRVSGLRADGHLTEREGDGNLLRGNGTLTFDAGRWGDITLGRVEAEVTLDGHAADIDVRAPAFAATAQAHVLLDAPYDATVDARADAVDLAGLLRLVDAPTPLTGTAT